MDTSSIPKSAAPFFQEYNFQRLDPTTDRSLIVARILAYGNREELRWLFNCYGRKEIQSWVIENGFTKLPLKRYNLWCVLLEVQRITPLRPKVWKY
jgi:hypothetical protein